MGRPTKEETLKKQEELNNKENENILETKEPQKTDDKDKQIEDLKNMILQMQATMLTMQNSNSQQQNSDETSMYKYINVVSLYDGTLNLTTSRNNSSNNNIYTFKGFGDSRRIMYAELKQIITSNHKFANQGYFYIADEQIVKECGLEDVYTSILSKEQVEKFLNNDKETIIELYSSIPEGQRNIVADYLILKMAKGTEFDLNKISAISKLYGKDLVEASKDLENALKYKGK